MTVWHKTPEYMLISAYYGDKCAKRSGVPLMNHIREGIKLLIAWDRPEVEQRAFALHPIFQAGGSMGFRTIAPSDQRPIADEVIDLAKEYGKIANTYLCQPEKDAFTIEGDWWALKKYLGNMSTSCAWMLLADKVQNQKDFRIHHWFTHERARYLEAYFNHWIGMLRLFYCI